jgi:hypothetical protein
MPKPAISEPPKPVQPAERISFWPKEVTRRDFFRLRRSGNGSVVEMVRLSADRKTVEFVRDVHEWDMLQTTEKRLLSLSFDAERSR